MRVGILTFGLSGHCPDCALARVRPMCRPPAAAQHGRYVYAGASASVSGHRPSSGQAGSSSSEANMSSIDMTIPRDSRELPPCIDLAQLGITAAAASCRPRSSTAADPAAEMSSSAPGPRLVAATRRSCRLSSSCSATTRACESSGLGWRWVWGWGWRWGLGPGIWALGSGERTARWRVGGQR